MCFREECLAFSKTDRWKQSW